LSQLSLVFFAAYLRCPLRERREHKVFQQLLQTVPGIEIRLFEGSDDDVDHIAELVRMTFTILILQRVDIPQAAERLLHG
jgi:hypothetical protein